MVGQAAVTGKRMCRGLGVDVPEKAAVLEGGCSFRPAVCICHQLPSCPSLQRCPPPSPSPLRRRERGEGGDGSGVLIDAAAVFFVRIKGG